MSEYTVDLPKILEALNSVDIKVLYFITAWLVIWKTVSVIKILVNARNEHYEEFLAREKGNRPPPSPPPPSPRKR